MAGAFVVGGNVTGAFVVGGLLTGACVVGEVVSDELGELVGA